MLIALFSYCLCSKLSILFKILCQDVKLIEIEAKVSMHMYKDSGWKLGLLLTLKKASVQKLLERGAARQGRLTSFLLSINRRMLSLCTRGKEPLSGRRPFLVTFFWSNYSLFHVQESFAAKHSPCFPTK